MDDIPLRLLGHQSSTDKHTDRQTDGDITLQFFNVA